METLDATEPVGPILKACPTADAVVAAIEELNKDAVVVDRGSYVRVFVPGRCFITREAVEEHLGRSFRFPGDLEKILLAFKGKFKVTEQEAVWNAGTL